jgi:hypothetical protein
MATNKLKKRAAIDIEKIRETPLAELTADRFLAALDEEKALDYLPYWPEKKKYELWVEPENVGRIPFERILDILKGEKKKYEYEIRFPLDRFADGSPEPMPLDKRLIDGTPMPVPWDRRYEMLLNRLADDLLLRLKEQLG